jgi:hypothetical protein
LTSASVGAGAPIQVGAVAVVQSGASQHRREQPRVHPLRITGAVFVVLHSDQRSLGRRR